MARSFKSVARSCQTHVNNTTLPTFRSKNTQKPCVKRVTGVCGKGGGNVARGKGGVWCRGRREGGVDGE